MARPQPDQYTKISNELMEAIPHYKLNGTQLRLLFVILRYTYGFNRKEWDLSLSFLSKSTGLRKEQVRHELSNLIKYNVVNVVREASFKAARVLALNKDYDTWLVKKSEQEDTQVTNLTPGNKLDHSQVTNLTPPQGINLFPPQGTNLTPKKEIFKEIFKENLKENIYTVFAHWNSKKIIEHRELTKKIEGHINARLEKYTVAEICEAINNYDTVLKGDDYFFSYKWTLAEFLTRDGGLPKFMAESDPLNNYRKNKGPPKDQKIPRGFASIREAVERSKNIEH